MSQQSGRKGHRPVLYQASIQARHYDRATCETGAAEKLTAYGDSARAAREALGDNYDHDYVDAEEPDGCVAWSHADVAELTQGKCSECDCAFEASHLGLHPLGDGIELLCVLCAIECADPQPNEYACLRTDCVRCKAACSTLDTEHRGGMCGDCSQDALVSKVDDGYLRRLEHAAAGGV